MRLRSTIILIVLVALAMISGCSNKSATTSGTSPSATPSSGIKVGIVSPALASVFHQTLVAGAQEQAKAEGWEAISMAPEKETDFAGEVAKIEDLIQLKVAAISICAIDANAIVSAVRKANAAKIPIFIHNALTPLPGGEVTAYIGYDEREAGKKCGEKAAKLLTEKYGSAKGKVAILEGVSGFHTQERTGGFLDALKKYPNIKVVAQQTADWDRTKAVDVTDNLLQSFPDIDLVYGNSDAMAQGAASSAARANKKVFTIGIDGNPDAIADVGAGKLTATCATNPKEMGKTVVKAMKDTLDGKKVPQFIKTETTIVDKTNWEKFK